VSKDEQVIMVVERGILFQGDAFQGFLPASRVDFRSRVLRNFVYRKRGEVESDPRFKQPIAYAVVFNSHQNAVFAYRRSTGAEDYDEDRLRGKWSWGVGGHIEAGDDPEGDPILSSLKRELAEETGLEGDFRPEVLGYVNDDTTDVGSVHFGILYVAEIERPEIRPRSPELASGSLRPLGELEDILADPRYAVEEWSALALPALKEYAATRTR